MNLEVQDWGAYGFGIWWESTSWFVGSSLSHALPWRRVKMLSEASFTSVLIPFMRASPARPNQPLIPSCEVSTHKFGGHKHSDHNSCQQSRAAHPCSAWWPSAPHSRALGQQSPWELSEQLLVGTCESPLFLPLTFPFSTFLPLARVVLWADVRLTDISLA